MTIFKKHIGLDGRVFKNIFLFIIGSFVVACGSTLYEINAAKTARYKTDFSTVFNTALQTVHEFYPHYVENPTKGTIITAWHPVNVTEGHASNGATNQSSFGNSSGQSSLYTNIYKHYFIRISVRVLGGSPWYVTVNGEASLFEAGSIPVPLHGENKPHWLEGRVEKLQIEIYNKLKKHVPNVLNKATQKPEIPSEAMIVIDAIDQALTQGSIALIQKHLSDSIVLNQDNTTTPKEVVLMMQVDDLLRYKFQSVLKNQCVFNKNETKIICIDKKNQIEFDLINNQWVLVKIALKH